MPVSRGRKRPARRRHQNGGNRRSAAAGDIFSAALHEARQLLALDHPLAGEMWCSGLLGAALKAAPADASQVSEMFAAELLASAQRSGRPEAAALVAGLAAVAPAETASAARDYLASDAGRAASLPAWAASAGQVRPTGTWLLEDAYGDQAQLVATFSYGEDVAMPRTHVLLWLVDFNMFGVAKDLFAAEDAEEVIDRISAAAGEEAGMRFAPIDPGLLHARALVAMEVADATYSPQDAKDGEDGETYAETRALALARLALLPPPAELVAQPEIQDAERADLVAEFLRSPEAQEVTESVGPDETPPAPAVLESCTRLAVDYALDYGAGDPLRWSPAAAEVFLLGWLPERTLLEEDDQEWMPEVLDSFVVYAGRLRGLDENLVDATQEAITELAPEFARLMASGERRGPAAELVASMQADGVDLSDPRAVDHWIAHYNASLPLRDG